MLQDLPFWEGMWQLVYRLLEELQEASRVCVQWLNPEKILRECRLDFLNET